MVLGIGTDLLRHARMARMAAGARRLRFARRILHPSEREGLAELTDREAAARLSSAWAAKEALYKALGRAEQPVCRFNQWRKVTVGGTDEMVSDLPRTDRLLVSLSHDGEYTLATVVRTTRSRA